MKLGAHAMRDAMVRSYADSYRRAQIKMDARAIEKQVIADCQLVDAARAAGDLKTGPKSKRTRKRERPDPLKKAQQATGTTLEVDAGRHVVKSRYLHQNPLAISERWGAAAARIGRILQGVNKNASSLVVAVEDAELAALATEYADLWSNFFLHFSNPAAASKNERNPFAGLSIKDAGRKFQRMVEDICDRSTGKLGSWYSGISETARARR